MLGIGYWGLGTGYWASDIGHWTSDICNFKHLRIAGFFGFLPLTFFELLL